MCRKEQIVACTRGVREGHTPCACYIPLLAILVLAGCSGKNLGPVGTVRGTVQLNGQSLPAGHAVVFTEPKSGRVAYGLTDGAGKFRLESAGHAQVAVGRYEAAIRPPSTDGDAGSVDIAANHAAATKKSPSKLPFGKKYLEPATSGLVYEVKTGENVFTIDLKE